MKTILKSLLVIIAVLFAIYYLIELYLYFFSPLMSMAPPPPMMGMEAGPIKINISEETPWLSIVKLLTTVLGTYLGIKVINKYIN